jgi:hypothetical protein
MEETMPTTPAVHRAFAILAALPDEVANFLGCWIGEDGHVGRDCTREEWRTGLLAGRVDPEAFVRNADLTRLAHDGHRFDAWLASLPSAETQALLRPAERRAADPQPPGPPRPFSAPDAPRLR